MEQPLSAAPEKSVADEAIRRLTDVSIDCVQGLVIASQKAEALQRTIDSIPEAIGKHLDLIRNSISSISDRVVTAERDVSQRIEESQKSAVAELSAIQGELGRLRNSFDEKLTQTSGLIQTLSAKLSEAALLSENNASRRTRSMRREFRVMLWLIVLMLAYSLFGTQAWSYAQHLWR